MTPATSPPRHRHPCWTPASASLWNVGSSDYKEPSRRPQGGLHLKNRSFSLLRRSTPEQPNLGFTLGRAARAGGGLKE